MNPFTEINNFLYANTGFPKSGDNRLSIYCTSAIRTSKRIEKKLKNGENEAGVCTESVISGMFKMSRVRAVQCSAVAKANQ